MHVEVRIPVAWRGNVEVVLREVRIGLDVSRRVRRLQGNLGESEGRGDLVKQQAVRSHDGQIAGTGADGRPIHEDTGVERRHLRERGTGGAEYRDLQRRLRERAEEVDSVGR